MNVYARAVAIPGTEYVCTLPTYGIVIDMWRDGDDLMVETLGGPHFLHDGWHTGIELFRIDAKTGTIRAN